MAEARSESFDYDKILILIEKQLVLFDTEDNLLTSRTQMVWSASSFCKKARCHQGDAIKAWENARNSCLRWGTK